MTGPDTAPNSDQDRIPDTAAHWAVIDHNGVLILRCACGWHAGTLFDAAKHDQEAHDGT